MQQKLLGKIWANSIKKTYLDKRGNHMTIRGKVTGNVQLTDIGRIVAYGATTALTQLEVSKSKDLQNAIRAGWVEVIEDKGMMQQKMNMQQPTIINNGFSKEEMMEMARAMASEMSKNQPIQPIQTPIDKDEMINMAKDMAKAMAAEMVKSSTDVQALAKEMAKEMSKEIQANLPINNGVIETEEKKKLKLDDIAASNVFIDIEDKGIKISSDNIGEVKKDNTDITNQLEKMKRFKRVAK